MGLGAPKRRNKLSHDPNNTAWSRSTQNFGHRILSSQGWQPGDYLGAKEASHSEHYSSANASHIRVLLREDNLGLGAQVGGNKAETFGLSLFSGVLGRLNGKGVEEVEKQQGQLRDAELRSYAGQKYGMVGFVSGGLLVGDRIEKPGETSKADNIEEAKDSKTKKRKVVEVDSDEGAVGKKRKKSKSKDIETARIQDEDTIAITSRKTKKKSKRADVEGAAGSAEGESNDDGATELAQRKSAKKERKQRRAEQRASDDLSQPSADEKMRLKQEKRARKEERRRRKEEKRRLKSEKQNSSSSESEDSPTVAVQATVAVNGGRHAVRQRYIQQKRMASMSAQAMKEIFMLQAGA